MNSVSRKLSFRIAPMLNRTNQNWLQHASYVEHSPWHDVIPPSFDLHTAILMDFECSCSAH